jgi:hypothetical protein
MTPIEIMALIVAVFVGFKLLVILISPKSWMGIVKTVTIWKNPIPTILVSIVLAAVTLMYLLQELTIVQIFATTLFVMFLMIISLSSCAKATLALEKQVFRELDVKKLSMEAWLAIIVWGILTIWVLWALFA